MGCQADCLPGMDMTATCQRGAEMYCTNYNHEDNDEWGDDVANNDVGKLASEERLKCKHLQTCCTQCVGAHFFTILYE